MVMYIILIFLVVLDTATSFSCSRYAWSRTSASSALIPPRIHAGIKAISPNQWLKSYHPILARYSSSQNVIVSIKDRLDSPNDFVVRAIDNLSSSKKKQMTVADIAAACGADLRTAKRNAVLISSLVQADLKVGKDGDILYVFPDNIRYLISKRSLFLSIKTVFTDTIFPALYYGLRVSFGAALIASIAFLTAVFVTIVVAASSTSSNKRDKDKDNRKHHQHHYHHFNSFNHFSTFNRDRNNYSFRFQESLTSRSNPTLDELPFKESFFSFVFGDGNPNKGIYIPMYTIEHQHTKHL
jgi:hypothetical protein